MIGRILDFQSRMTGYSFFEAVKRYAIFISGGFVGWLILIGTHRFVQGEFVLSPVLSYGLGMLFADIFTFSYHRLVTFKIGTRWKLRLLKFTIILMGISFVNWAAFSISRSVFNIPVPDEALSFVITGILSVANFLINRLFVFRRK